jgi:hypothetical protein
MFKCPSSEFLGQGAVRADISISELPLRYIAQFAVWYRESRSRLALVNAPLARWARFRFCCPMLRTGLHASVNGAFESFPAIGAQLDLGRWFFLPLFHIHQS